VVDHIGARAVGHADEPRRERRPAAHDLPVELRAFDGGQRQIAQDEGEGGPLLKKHKGFGAVGDAVHLVPISREDIDDEHAHVVTGFDHQDAGGPRPARYHKPPDPVLECVPPAINLGLRWQGRRERRCPLHRSDWRDRADRGIGSHAQRSAPVCTSYARFHTLVVIDGRADHHAVAHDERRRRHMVLAGVREAHVPAQLDLSRPAELGARQPRGCIERDQACVVGRQENTTPAARLGRGRGVEAGRRPGRRGRRRCGPRDRSRDRTSTARPQFRGRARSRNVVGGWDCLSWRRRRADLASSREVSQRFEPVFAGRNTTGPTPRISYGRIKSTSIALWRGPSNSTNTMRWNWPRPS